MLVEHAILIAAAGVLGWRATTWGIRAWAASTTSPYQILDYSIDSTTIAYLAAVCVVSALLYSIAPIVRLTQLAAGGAIVSHARGVTQPMRSRRLSAGLVAGQMALAIILLSGAGVLVRSLLNIVGADTGVREPERILVGEPSGCRRLPTRRPTGGLHTSNGSRESWFPAWRTSLWRARSRPRAGVWWDSTSRACRRDRTAETTPN
jgi:hypothetical protein